MKHLIYILLALNITGCAGAEIMAKGMADGLKSSDSQQSHYVNYYQPIMPKTQVCNFNVLGQMVCTEQ